MARINAVSFHEDPSIESICQKVVRAGFDSIELSRPPFYEKLITSGTRKRFAEWSADLGLSLYGFDCWVDVDPYSNFDETLSEFQLAVEWASDLNLGMLISHDPWMKVNGDRSSDRCLKVNIDLFTRVADMCLENGLKLVFEPHPDTYSMDNNWSIDFIDSIAEERPPGSVGLLFDCCHYGVGQPANYVESIKTLGSRIQHIHYSDGDSNTYALHLPIGYGSLDLDGVASALQAIDFNGTLTCDMFNYPLLEDGARLNVSRIMELEQKLGLEKN